MPYIPQDRRAEIDSGMVPQTPGELEYKLMWECVRYLRMRERRFATMNEIVGVLETTKMEFARRVLRTYEDRKLVEAGDIHGLE